MARNKQSFYVNTPITIIDIFLRWKTAQYSLAIGSYFVLIESNILIMDKFVKTPSASSQEKKKIAPISAKDRARKYSEGTFHVDDGLLFTLQAESPLIFLGVLLFVQHSG